MGVIKNIYLELHPELEESLNHNNQHIYKEDTKMMSMNINGGSSLEIKDDGKVVVSKDLVDDIQNNAEISDDNKKPEFEIKDNA